MFAFAILRLFMISFKLTSKIFEMTIAFTNVVHDSKQLLVVVHQICNQLFFFAVKFLQ